MRGLGQMIVTEFRLFLREPSATFFTLAFPLILLFTFGSAFGNDPDPELGGWGAVDNSVMGYFGLVIGTVALMSIPVTIASYRQYGILKRLRATPVSAAQIVLAQIVVNGVLTAIGTILLVVAGKIFYDLRMPEMPWQLVLAWLVSYFSFATFGFLLGGMSATSRSAQAIGSAIYFPQIFLSGASFPRQLLPDWLQRVTEYFPMTQIYNLVTGLWHGDGWDWTALISLTAIGVISAVLSFRFFRWE
ncbi:MAG: ABC transporter permease [Thermomicrobiales bacterium]